MKSIEWDFNVSVKVENALNTDTTNCISTAINKVLST